MARLDRDLRSTRPEDLTRRFGRIAVAAAPTASVLRLIGAMIDVVLDHRPKHPFVAPAMLGTLTLGLYGWNVGLVPNYLFVDEAMFALQAHSIATTAHDLSGRLLPAYFQMVPLGPHTWFQPAIVYFMAAFLAVLPLTEAVIRWPSVAVGAIDVVLLYFIAKRVFQSERWAVVAAIFLMLTPSHFVHSRMAMDYLYPVPFLLTWLLCLLIYLDRRHSWTLVVATSALGLGVFSYIASAIMMPVYLLLTGLALFKAGVGTTRPYLAAAGGFIWPLLLVSLWLWYHPSTLVETLAKYHVGEHLVSMSTGNGRSTAEILRALRSSVHVSDLTRRLSLYWSFFDPPFLFLMGGYAQMASWTRRVGVFLLPFLVLVPAGLVQMRTLRRRPIELLLLWGFASAPLAACLVVSERYAIGRELELLPFGALIATHGTQALISAPHRLSRMFAVGLLALIPLHGGFFLYDYFWDYPLHAGYWYQGNRRGAIEEILARAPRDRAPAIYLNRAGIPYVDAHWQLYLVKNGREDLLQHTVYLDSTNLDVHSAPAGSLVLTTQDDPVAAAMLTRIATLPELGNPPFYALFEK